MALTAECSTCHEPRVPLIRCATCDAMSCDLCSFGTDLICLRCNQRRDNVTKEEPMTLQDAISEMHALYPGKYVSVTLGAAWHEGADRPTVEVNCYVDGVGHIAWAARSIDAGIREVHAKRAGSDASDLLISDADIAPMVSHVA